MPGINVQLFSDYLGSFYSIETSTMAGDSTFNVNSLARIYLEIRRKGIYDR